MLMPRRALVTTRTCEVFGAAHALADQLGHEDTTPLHVALCLLQEGMNMAAQILLYSCQLPRDIFHGELEAQLPPSRAPRAPGYALDWSTSDEHMLGLAAVEARELGSVYFGCEHLLLAFLRDSSSGPARVLAAHGVSFDRVRQDVQSIYNRTMVWAGPAT